MVAKFRFEDTGSNYFGRVLRPVAKVSFNSLDSDSWIEAWMIVDTGADFTILPHYLAKELQISLESDCIQDKTFGVGGERMIYLCKKKIKAKLGKIEREIPLGFFDNNEVPALLGRLGFMETLNTEFTKNHTVIFKE
ncbi:MAG: aspartyl protease family protein [Patescibacteria group bacterium]